MHQQHELLREHSSDGVPGRFSNPAAMVSAGANHHFAGTPSLIEVLWHRRWMLLATVLLSTAGAAVYLLMATPIYQATARVSIEQSGPRVFGESQGFVVQSENYLQTQADLFESAPVLQRALDTAEYRGLKMFAAAKGDPVEWLRRSGSLNVEVSRKSDVVSIAIQSAYPEEAARLANSIVSAYRIEQSQHKREAGLEMVRVLQNEKDQLERKRDASLAAMLKQQRDSGVLSFREDKGNTALERTAALSTALTSAEINTLELRSQLESVKAALANPLALKPFVEGLQFKGRDFGDREYDDLRNQLGLHELSMSLSSTVQGSRNPRVRSIGPVIESLRQRIAAKEKSIAEAQLAAVTAQLAVAEKRERDLRSALADQRARTIDMSPAAMEHARLEAEVGRIQKQCDLLENRIAEVNVNSIEAAPLNVQVIELARAADRPVKPKKPLVLAAALMAGLVLGSGLALMREWKDGRLRTPEEILTVLGTPVLALVPRINGRLSAVARGQLVRLDARSPAAEAYRSARTLVNLGSMGGSAKTILLASPTPGDGKSTTASNLAIAYAQSGDRTLLVDCDLREPVQHLIFETDGSIGLSSVMSGEAKLRDAIAPTRIGGLYLLPCGPVPENPSELLAGKRFSLLMHALGGTFDRIIIDSPPLMSVTDARILAASADATLLVLRMNRSVRTLGAMALDGLERVGANVLGAIANDVPSSRAYHYYGGSWQYAKHLNRRIPVAPAEDRGGRGRLRSEPAMENEDAGQLSRDEVLAIAEPDWSAQAG